MAISFDGPTKRITLSSGTTDLGVRDLWSRWVDWLLTSDNSKYLTAFEQVGGNDIDTVAGTSIPIYAFLKNGWRIKPQEADHTLNVADGILLVDGGGDPFVSTTGDYTVRINYQQPVSAITVSTSGGGGGTVDPDDIFDHPDGVEPGITLRQGIRAILATLTGKATGGGSPTIAFRDPSDTTNRVTLTVDESGNRSNVTLNV